MEVFRGLQFESDAEIGQIGHSWMGTTYMSLCRVISGGQKYLTARPDDPVPLEV